jgi:hypothetical protein
MNLRSRPFYMYCRTVLYGSATFAAFFVILMTCFTGDFSRNTGKKYAAMQQEQHQQMR